MSPDAASRWRDAGVTRVSLGIQSFNDDVLRWMHRTHDASQARQAAATLKGAGFDDWSLDLIFALPPEVERSWTDDLQQAIDLGSAHISCYGLTVEPHTPLVRWRERGQVHEADEERYEADFLEADRLLTGAGFEHYEVSNYARPNRRAVHNSAYWQRVSYVGFGPSAHSFSTERAGAGTRASTWRGATRSWRVGIRWRKRETLDDRFGRNRGGVSRIAHLDGHPRQSRKRQ